MTNKARRYYCGVLFATFFITSCLRAGVTFLPQTLVRAPTNEPTPLLLLQIAAQILLRLRVRRLTKPARQVSN